MTATATTEIMQNDVTPQESVSTISRTSTPPLTIETPTSSAPPPDNSPSQIHIHDFQDDNGEESTVFTQLLLTRIRIRIYLLATECTVKPTMTVYEIYINT